MKAAIVSSFEQPPGCGEFRDPEPRPGFVEVRMLAAGVHHVVRSLAAGAHYGTGDELPFVPGVDGVGVLPDGTRVFTGGTPDPFGTIAERAVVPEAFAVPVPDGLSSAHAAAVVNPAMSSWMPLVASPMRRDVLVLGATGVAGRLAVRTALHLGARRVIAAGRNHDVLDELAADPRVRAVGLDELPGALADGVDVVLDYVWGPAARTALDALRRTGLAHTARPVRYVQIGAAAGPEIVLDAALLRSSAVTISGSGAGSVTLPDLLREIPEILRLAADGELVVNVREVPLADVATAWDAPDRLVVSLPVTHP